MASISKRRSVGSEDGAATRDSIELRKHFAFQIHAFEHRLDDHVGVAQLFVVERGAYPRHALRLFVRRETAAVHHGLIDAVDVGEPTLERSIVGVDQRHRNAGIRETDGDAAAHGARPDDARGLDGRCGNLVANSRHAAAVALGEEHVYSASRFDALLAVVGERGLEFQAFGETGLRGLAHRFHRNEAGVPIRIELARLSGHALEDFVGGGGAVHLHGAGAPGTFTRGEQRSRVADGAGAQIPLDDVVEEPQFFRL